MAIIYKIEADGGFVCGDTNTGLTAYAYPTSPHASNAAKSPAQAQKTADAMIKAESPIRRSPNTDYYDKWNWGKLYPQISKSYSSKDAG
jgi:hypothetical protein